MNPILTAALVALAALVSACSSAAPTRAVEAQTLIIDDYDAAREEALRTERPLLVSFTGHTCVNCRQMEVTIFTQPAFASALGGYVEARLHSDAQDPGRCLRTLCETAPEPT